jgi:hypothetical protein
MSKEIAIFEEVVIGKIPLVRGQMMLGKDLAELYNVATENLKIKP